MCTATGAAIGQGVRRHIACGNGNAATSVGARGHVLARRVSSDHQVVVQVSIHIARSNDICMVSRSHDIQNVPSGASWLVGGIRRLLLTLLVLRDDVLTGSVWTATVHAAVPGGRRNDSQGDTAVAVVRPDAFGRSFLARLGACRSLLVGSPCAVWAPQFFGFRPALHVSARAQSVVPRPGRRHASHAAASRGRWSGACHGSARGVMRYCRGKKQRKQPAAPAQNQTLLALQYASRLTALFGPCARDSFNSLALHTRTGGRPDKCSESS